MGIIAGKVLIKPMPTEEVTKGGIIIPHKFQKNSSIGEIVQITEAKGKKPSGFKKGDVVFFKNEFSKKTNIDGEDLMLSDFSNIIFKQ